MNESDEGERGITAKISESNQYLFVWLLMTKERTDSESAVSLMYISILSPPILPGLAYGCLKCSKNRSIHVIWVLPSAFIGFPCSIIWYWK